LIKFSSSSGQRGILLAFKFSSVSPSTQLIVTVQALLVFRKSLNLLFLACYEIHHSRGLFLALFRFQNFFLVLRTCFLDVDHCLLVQRARHEGWDADHGRF
jgi:hypothetical protein